MWAVTSFVSAARYIALLLTKKQLTFKQQILVAQKDPFCYNIGIVTN